MNGEIRFATKGLGGSALSRSVVSLSRSVEVCRAVELDTLTPRHMQSGGVLSRSVENCRVAVELSCRVAVEYPVK